jgi:hypothetical protein
VCRDHRLQPDVNSNNSWIISRAPEPIRTYRDHVNDTLCHQSALDLEAQKKKSKEAGGIEGSMEKAAEQSIGALRNHFVVAHTLAVLNSPTSHYDTWMKVLHKECKVDVLSTLKHRNTARHIQYAIGTSLQHTLVDDVNKSGLPFGILIDESTDVATKKSLILYVRYINEHFIPITKFCA